MEGRKNVKQFLSQQPHLQELYDGKLAYIAAQKESVSGMFNNQRFIVVNGKQLTLGYSNQIPGIVPIGSFLNIKNIKKKAFLEDVLIQRSKHKLKAIEIIVQKFKYKDRQEKIPQQWVFYVSSTKAADQAVELFNQVKAEALSQATKRSNIFPSVILIPSEPKEESKEDKQVINSQPASQKKQLQIPQQPQLRKKSQIKIAPQPVIEISISNRPKPSPSLSINPTLNVVSQPKHFMYSQVNNRYQLQQRSIPVYYNQTKIHSVNKNSEALQTIYIDQHPLLLSRQEVSQNSIQHPITHHTDSPKMPQSIVNIKDSSQIQTPIKYELQVRSVQGDISSSFANTKHSHPNNSILSNNIPVVVEVSEKQSISQKSQKPNSQYLSMGNMSTPKSKKSQQLGSNPPPFSRPSEILINIDSSKKGNTIEAVIKQPISPIQKRQRTKSRYAIDNFEMNSNSSGSPSRLYSQKQKLVNVWDEESPQLVDFTLKSSPVKNRFSPSKLMEVPPQQPKSTGKRRATQYSVVKNSKDWNQQLYFSTDPLDTITKFKHFSSQIAMEIINSFGSLDNKFHILKQSQSEIIYQHQNLILSVAFNPNSDKNPIKHLGKYAENYIYMNQILQNKQFCRVPLVNLIKYKGIAVLVKATLGNSTKINKNSLSNQIKKLENITKIPRQQFSKCSFKLVTYFNRGTSSEIIFIDQLEQLVPSNQRTFRKELIEMASKEKGLIQSYLLSRLLQKQIDKFILALEKLQISILSSQDLSFQLHKHGISKSDMGTLYNKTSLQFTKQMFTSQLLSETASELFSTHLQNQIKTLARKKQRHSDRYLIQAAYEFMDDLCSATNNSQALWDVITNDTESRYKIKVERKYLMWGYFLSAFLQKGGLKFNINSLDKSTGFSEQYNCINSHSLQGFLYQSNSSTADYVDLVNTTKSILSQSPSEYGYQKLRLFLQNSSFLAYIKQQPRYFNLLLIYLSNFITPDINTKTILNPYESISPEPSTSTTVQLNISKLKWFLKRKDEQSAVNLMQQSCEHIHFWGAQFHPLMSQFYDLVASYYVGIGESEEALTLAKSSLVNIIKLVGNNSLATADKFYFLANVMYNIGKNEQAFNNFSKAREILLEQSLTNTILGKIELKMSMLYFHFGKSTDSQLAAKQALQVFNENKEELLLVETYQLLDRIYKVGNNTAFAQQNALDCASKLESSRNEEVYIRVLKLALSSFLGELSAHNKKTLLQTIQMLNINQSKKEYFSWLYKKGNIVQTTVNYLRGMDELSKEMRIANIQKYKGINVKSQNHLFVFLSYMEAVIGVVDLAPLTGILRSYD